MATDKRQRQKQGRQERLEAQRLAVARTRRNRSIRNAIIFAVVVVVAAVVLSKTGHKDKTDSVKSNAASTTTAPSTSAATCPPTDGTAKRTLSFRGTLKQCLKAGATYEAVLTTTQGQVDITLDTKRTPKTTNAFVALSRWKYYDGTKLFRTEKTTGIIQGGSPHTQSNTDPGPGFPIADEGGTFTAADYGPGVLAMARTSSPNSANGQFFLLSGTGARYLGDKKQLGSSAGTYVVFGKVTKGLDVLKKISALDTGSGKPAASKVPIITKVAIKQS